MWGPRRRLLRTVVPEAATDPFAVVTFPGPKRPPGEAGSPFVDSLLRRVACGPALCQALAGVRAALSCSLCHDQEQEAWCELVLACGGSQVAMGHTTGVSLQDCLHAGAGKPP